MGAGKDVSGTLKVRKKKNSDSATRLLETGELKKLLGRYDLQRIHLPKLLASLGALLVLRVVLSGLTRWRTAPSEAASIQVEQQVAMTEAPTINIYEALGGFGQAVASEIGMKGAILVGSVKARSLEQALSTIEHHANRGWNVSSPEVLPLGQFGYVKRDLPVYKDGFNRLDIQVMSRPKSGLFTEQQLSTEPYNMILCLSFNTDMCFDPALHHLIDKSKRVNRIQNLRDVIWSKHKFCKTISNAVRGLHDTDLLSFTFPCWVMPHDYEKMIKYSNENRIQTWIAKPRSLGAGMGIYIVSNRDQLEKEQSSSNVVQTYLEDPHLIEKPGLTGDVGKFKWDMRTYVVVTSVTPLRAYLYRRGLVRISTSPYTKDCSANITACLTNTSLNKKVEGAQLKDITWSFSKLRDYLKKFGIEFDVVLERIQRAIGLTLLSAESELLRHFTPKGFACENCYQLLGVDVIFDQQLIPKVVEINGEPNLKCTSNGKTHYDFTKKGMTRDLVGLVFNPAPQARRVTNALKDWSKHITGDKTKTAIGEDHLRYILATFREQANIGNFAPIYPNFKLAEPYGRLLRFLRDKEVAKPELGGVHVDGRRYRLHQIMTYMHHIIAQEQQATPQLVEDGEDESSGEVEADERAEEHETPPAQMLRSFKSHDPARNEDISEEVFR